MSSRFHPYSQSQKTDSVKAPKGKKIEVQSVLKPKINPNITVNYEYKSYLEDASTLTRSNVYPTLMQPTTSKKSEADLKGILKNRTNNPVKQSSKLTDGLKWVKENKVKPKSSNLINKEEDKELECLKLFTGTTKSIKIFTEIFEENSKNKVKRKVGAHLFEIYAQLDSSVSKIEEANKCIFTIKDNHDRMKCVFVEIDREMPKIPRSSYIRCVGKYKIKNSEFQCISIRVATQAEIFTSSHHISQTNSFIKQKYC